MKKIPVLNISRFIQLILPFVLFSSISGEAQTTIDSVLASVLKNNKSIQATTQYWETRKLEFKTGMLPGNPQIEYDYLKGSPAGAGNQTEISVFQSFDFPSAYSKRKQLSDQQSEQVQHQVIAKRQEVLMEAKLVCIELVYRNKLTRELVQRKENAETLLANFEIKLDKGDGNILDVNKARIQLIGVSREFQENRTALNQLSEKLASLNGGNAIVFNDTAYFSHPEIPDFEQLEAQYGAADPLRKLLEQEKLIVQKELELSRALSYPKFEAGYHYQGILGQNYNGIHTGITIPLWESRNTVKAKKSQLLFADLEIQDHKNEQNYEIRRSYERYLILKVMVNEYKNTIESVNADYLLNKSLTSGHISAIEYFMELNYYSNVVNSYLQMEKEYHQVIAELYKFLL